MIIYNGQLGLWSPAFYGTPSFLGGSGKMIVPDVSDDQTHVISGCSSSTLLDFTVSGFTTYQWTGAVFSPQAYFSVNQFLSFWLYGANAGNILVILIDSSMNEATFELPETWSGWQEVSINVGQFSTDLGVNFAQIVALQILFDTAPRSGYRWIDLVQTADDPNPQTGPAIDFSVPLKPTGQTLYTGNYIVARVEGDVQLLTSAQLDKIIRAGKDFFIVSIP